MKIRAVNSSKNLLKVIKNPVTDHLPKNINIFKISKDGEKTKPNQFFEKNWEEKDDIAIIIPCSISKLEKSSAFSSNKIKISNFELSPSGLLAKLIISAEDRLCVDQP